MTAVEYIELSGVPESRWPNFREWFKWYQDNNLVGIARDGDKISGVAIARCLHEGEDPVHYVHRPTGSVAFVDLTVTSTDGSSTPYSRLAMKTLLSILWDQLGPRKNIVFNRGGKRKVYDYMKFMRKALL